VSQYQAGLAVSPRPVLELVKQPLYDRVSLVANATQTTFFAIPVGGADLLSITGNKSFSETNMRRAGALATPQQFDIYATSWKLPSDAVLADWLDTLNITNYNLEVGQKSYLRCRTANIPGDTGFVVNESLVASANATNGWPMATNVFDTSIPEELFDPATGRTFLTGRRVPIHLPSEQQWSVTLEHVGGLRGAFVTAPLNIVLWGVLKREVQ
jgi:hypothetical protein